MQYLGIYSRALSFLKPEQRLSILLVGASLLVSALNIAQALLFGWTLQTITQGQGVITLVLIFAALSLMALGLQMSLTQQADRLAHRRRAVAMTQFFEKSLSQPTQDGGKERLLNVMQRGSDQLYLLLLSFYRDHLSAFFTLLLIVPVALWLNAQLALLLLASAALFTALNVFLTSRASGTQEGVEKFHANAAGRAADVMDNAQIVNAYARLEAETRGLDEMMQRLLSSQYPALDWFARKSVVFGACLALTLTGLLALGSYLYNETQVGLYELVGFAGLAILLLVRAERLTGFASTLLFKTKALADFFTLLDAESVVRELPGAEDLILRKGQIEFRNVSADGIRNLNLVIAADEAVAVIDVQDHASTLGALLLRTLDPKSGEILIDQQNVNEVTLASLRKHVALAGSKPLLLNRTIMENLTLGKPNATQNDVIGAVQKAGAHDFIGASAGGFHMLLKDDTLNDAEAERLGIARAILKDAPIVIFDETQAPLANEAADAIAQLLEGRTALLVPRRLSTLQKAARIVVLENGAIIESGSYEDLIKKKGALAKLVSDGRFSSTKITPLKKRTAAGE